jgi:hypothetical protein
MRPAALPLLALVLVSPLAAQGGSWSACRTDSLSTYNCASYYSGTVTLASALKGQGVDQRETITATVTAGKVSCRAKRNDGPEVTGTGMIAVEHGNTADAGGYEIKVWCPMEAGERVGRSSSPGIEVMDQEAANYRTLQGKDEYEHPDSDEANGLAGTVTVTWRLERK